MYKTKFTTEHLINIRNAVEKSYFDNKDETLYNFFG